jgi:hypothetical protein
MLSDHVRNDRNGSAKEANMAVETCWGEIFQVDVDDLYRAGKQSCEAELACSDDRLAIL